MVIKIWSYGGGTDSTAALVESVNRDIEPPHRILMADPGAEQPRTYVYRDMFSSWLVERGYPPIETVYPLDKHGLINTLEKTCSRLRTMPSAAFGFKTCSQRFKIDPQDRTINRDPVCKAEWKAGRKIVKLVGYNFDEVWRAKFYETDKSINEYPLIQWEIGKEQARVIIPAAGLLLPGKSSCFFCPHMTKIEIAELNRDHPDLAFRALMMEIRAKIKGWRSKKIKGLGRKFSWFEYLYGGNLDEELTNDDQPCGCYDG